MTDAPKSQSGPSSSGQPAASTKQPIFQASPLSAWNTHSIPPISLFTAIIASLVSAAEDEYEAETVGPVEEETDESGNEETEDAQEDNSEDVDYSKMSVAELKDILKEKKLPVSGKKAELIERLQGDSKWVVDI